MMFILLILMTGYMWHIAHRDVIRFALLEHQNLPHAFHGYKIFFIADIHKRVIRRETIEKINDPIDMVCIAGDLLEKNVPLQRVRENILLLKEWQAPIYFVWGNNDFEVDTADLAELLRGLDVTILEDEIIQVNKANEKINVLGFKYVDVEQGLREEVDWNRLTDQCTILITHKPNSFKKLPEIEKNCIDIVLTGHTHGGQIRMMGLGFYENGGIEKQNKTLVLTTEGYGYSILPFRLGTTAECHVLTLKRTTYNP